MPLFQKLGQNPSYGNELDLHENEAVGRIHFLMNDFACTCRLVLIQRQSDVLKYCQEVLQN